jgi:hypothetical protein
MDGNKILLGCGNMQDVFKMQGFNRGFNYSMTNTANIHTCPTCRDDLI